MPRPDIVKGVGEQRAECCCKRRGLWKDEPVEAVDRSVAVVVVVAAVVLVVFVAVVVVIVSDSSCSSCCCYCF